MSLGCQFFPVNNHYRFVRLSETTPVGSEVMQIEVHPRRNLSLQPTDNVSITNVNQKHKHRED